MTLANELADGKVTLNPREERSLKTLTEALSQGADNGGVTIQIDAVNCEVLRVVMLCGLAAIDTGKAKY